MSKTTCDIQFHENPSKIFYGGQLLQGRVILNIPKSKTVRGIYVKIEGKSNCHFTTGSGKNTKTHKDEEIYFSTKTFFVGGEEGEIEVQPGIYTYTFQCALPIRLPTSLEGKFGHIRYSVLVNLDRPLWPDEEFLETFSIMNLLNLNDIRSLRDPVTTSSNTTFNRLLGMCFKTGPLTITGNMPKTGYAPGEQIHHRTTIYNRSVDIQHFYIRMMKLIYYYSNTHGSRSKCEEITVIEKKLDGVAFDQTQTYDTVLVVPPISPTDTEASSICKVQYIVSVSGKSNLMFEDEAKLDMSITIGSYALTESGLLPSQTIQPSVPLYQQQEQQQQQLMPSGYEIINNENPSAPLLNGGGTAEEAGDLPTFEEATAKMAQN